MTTEQRKHRAEQLRLAADIEEFEKEWEHKLPEMTFWQSHDTRKGPLFFIHHGCEIRRKPWTLPDPPPGRAWHRVDGWKEEDLPDGWRPLLKGEFAQSGDSYRSDTSPWRTQTHDDEVCCDILDQLFQRTIRPLPPTTKTVPIGPEDWDGLTDLWVTWPGHGDLRVNEIQADFFIAGMRVFAWNDTVTRVWSTDRKNWRPFTKEVTE